jgi:hypothetical protein
LDFVDSKNSFEREHYFQSKNRGVRISLFGPNKISFILAPNHISGFAKKYRRKMIDSRKSIKAMGDGHSSEMPFPAG